MLLKKKNKITTFIISILAQQTASPSHSKIPKSSPNSRSGLFYERKTEIMVNRRERGTTMQNQVSSIVPLQRLPLYLLHGDGGLVSPPLKGRIDTFNGGSPSHHNQPTSSRPFAPTLQLEYLDLYLIHWPLSSTPGKFSFPIAVEDLLPFDVKGVWESMEECLKLGLTKAIGVSNFSVKKLQNLLSVANILPAVNQVEMNLAWQQKELREFCNANEIVLTAFSPLRKGASRGPNEVMENDMLKEIAEAHGKSIALVSLRWLYEQGVTFAAKSYDKERMNQNLQIFDWALTKEDHEKIDQINQSRLIPGPTKPQLNDLFDDQA